MPEDLGRRFRDKIQGRPPLARPSPASTPPEAAVAGTAEAIRVREIGHGILAASASLNPAFADDSARVRLILDLPEPIRRRGARLGMAEREGLLSLCPHLEEHTCGDARSAPARPFGADPSTGRGRPGPESEADGLPLAHLIEHVAIELLAAVSGSPRCSGAACAYLDHLDRYDIFLEGAEPALVRAAALLATAAVRDLCLGNRRMPLHRRCRDLLMLVSSADRGPWVAEDVALALGVTIPEALETLHAVARLRYLEPVQASFTFSSTTGLIFRRVMAEPSQGA